MNAPAPPAGNRRPILALASALGVALIVIAFLVGRLTAAPATTVVVPGPAIAAARGTPAAAPENGNGGAGGASAPMGSTEAITSPHGAAPPPPSVALSATDSGTPETAPVSVGGVPGRPASGGSDRAAVAAYFNALEKQSDIGVGDPQAFAKSILDSVGSGDFSSFDSLVTKARAQRDLLRGLTPPSECAAHHRLALTLSERSVTMLEKMRGSLSNGDSMALLSIATEAKALESQANELKTMGDAIKRNAGV
jgi:hypothetical protein